MAKLKQPIKQKTATHFVRTSRKFSRLALRDRPSFVSVSEEADLDEDKKGNRLIMMDNDTQLEIIEPFIGYACEWHQVLITDDDSKYDDIKKYQEINPIYCFAKFVNPFDRTKPFSKKKAQFPFFALMHAFFFNPLSAICCSMIIFLNFPRLAFSMIISKQSQ